MVDYLDIMKEETSLPPYRFIAIDVDGTLLDDQDHYDFQRLNRDVIALQQLGVTFIVASGNSYDALQDLFVPCPAITNFVAENGGRIITNRHEQYTHPHHFATITRLVKIVKQITPWPDLFSLSGARQTFIPQQFRNIPVSYYPHHTYFSKLNEIHEPIYNLNLNWFKQRPAVTWIQQITSHLNSLFPNINATYSGAFGIDILPAGVNKAVSLQKLIIDLLGGNMRELVAYGDTSNDIEMLQAAGCGIAMKNATPDLITVADRITKYDNNHSGLLTSIEELFHL